MSTLEAGRVLSGVAGTATAVTYTIETGDEYSVALGDVFKILAQGQLPSSVGTLYTVPASTVALVKKITLANTTGSAVSGVKLFTGGTAATNQITGSLTIPANGQAIITDHGLQVTDANGAVTYASSLTLTGDVTGAGTGTVATTLATVNANTGTFGDASHVPQVTFNGKGLATGVASILVTPTAIGAPTGSGTSTGTNTGDQTITLTSDVTGSGTGSFAATIANSAVSNAKLANMPGHTYKGNNTGVSGVVLDLTGPQLVADLPIATTTLAGIESAADKSQHNNWFNNTVYNAQDWGFSNNSTAAANVTAWNALTAAAIDGSTIEIPPVGPFAYLINAVLTIPSGKHFRIRGGGANGKTIIQSTSQTADFFAPADWYTTFEGITFQSTATTSTGAQTINTTPSTFTVGSTTNFVNGAGSGWVATTTGYQLFSWTGVGSPTTLTGVTVAAGSITTTAGGPVVFKTAGAAINAGNLVGIDMIACTGTNLFNGFTGSGSTFNLSHVCRNNMLNTINVDFAFDGANFNGWFQENNADCATTSRSVSHLDILQCGSIIGAANFLIRGQVNLRLGSTTAAYPAGVFSVDLGNTSFDNAGTDCVQIRGISAVQRIRFNQCGFTSAQGGKGLNLSSTAATLPTGIILDDCDVFSCSTDGVGGNGAQDLTITGGTQIAGCTNNGINSFVPRLYVNESRIGPIAGIGANGTGIILPAGAYTTVQINNNDVSGNTTAALTDNSTSITTRRILENVGLPIARANMTATAIPLTTVTNADSGGGLAIPAGFRPLKVRITVDATNAATTQTTTATLRFGTANTNADAAVATLALAAGTAVAGGGKFVFEFALNTATLAMGHINFFNGNSSTGISAGNQANAGSASPGATVSTAAAAFLGAYLSSATAAAVTVRSVVYEILSQ